MKKNNYDDNIIKHKKHRLKNRALYHLFLVILMFSPYHSVFSHGTVTDPPSRVWICYNEIIEDISVPIPESPACLSSFMSYGSQAFYDWNEVARMDADGMHQLILPEGNLASAGRPDKYGGLDQVRNDWVSTPVSPGPFTVTWTNTAPHQTLYYRVYITKADWTPEQPLSWDNLELLTETEPRTAAATDIVDVVLPQRSGKHVLFSVWQRSLSAEAFYATSDVDFGSRVIVSIAPEANFTTDSGICGGSEVLFDASSSFDANGDALTYTWDFGDGNTAEGLEVNHVFEDGLESSMVTLTVSDNEFSTGITETVSLIRNQNCSELVCSFDAPTENALPSISTSFNTLFVIGGRGPNLENITLLAVSWDGNNLNQFDFNFNVSPYFSSFSSANHTFGQSNPQISLEGTSIEDLDGDYYVTIDEGNLVLASIMGGFTIYFGKTDTAAPECDDNISVITETLRGGTLTDALPNNERFEFIVNDDTADYVSGITLEGNIGDNIQWLITDQSGIIIALPNDIESFNFDEIDSSDIEDQERLFIYNLSSNGSITGLNVGAITININGDYELSNALEVYVIAEGTTTEETTTETTNCTYGTPLSTPMPIMHYRSYNTDPSFNGSITVIGENGPDLSPYRKLDIAYNDSGVLGTFFFQDWATYSTISLLPYTEHTFGQVNPELTLSGTGIDNFDGSYYVNVIENEEFRADLADFIMVSKTGDFSIYFSFSENAPDCDDTLSVETNELENSILVQQNYPNPFTETTTIEYTLNQKSPVNLRIYDIKGNLVKTLNDGSQSTGTHKLTFDLSNMSDGIYIYIFETKNGTHAKRMVLQK